MASEIHINEYQNLVDSQKLFAQTGRIQIRNFLKRDHALELRESVAALDWRLVLNENGKHIDIHPLQLRQIPSDILTQIKKAARDRAKTQFQYLYENFPVFDILKTGGKVDPVVSAVYAALNSSAFKARLTELTGLSVDYCDIQATRYRAGHFLNIHDDDVEGKNRQLAFVLNLSQSWRKSWGGTLDFVDQYGTVEDRFVPVFNSLSLFKVPKLHKVSSVKPSSNGPRLSLTGWFRVN